MMYSVKMRASRREPGMERHISGAERIVEGNCLESVCSQLLSRAVNHARGESDFIHIKIEKIDGSEIKILDALPVTACEVKTAGEGRSRLADLLEKSGIDRGQEILECMKDTWKMRGAMLLHVDTLERMEPDPDRGVRATYMDEADGTGRYRKNHFREALVLATKVSWHKNIVGELCISDDPDYVTGYFASKKLGYVRITKLKERGCPDGGRIFLFRGSRNEAEECIRYLEKEKVLVKIPKDLREGIGSIG